MHETISNEFTTQIVANLGYICQIELCRGYIGSKGTSRSFWRRLTERTAQEMQIYGTRRELENESSPNAWESKNEALRRIGLRTIANPKEQE